MENLFKIIGLSLLPLLLSNFSQAEGFHNWTLQDSLKKEITVQETDGFLDVSYESPGQSTLILRPPAAIPLPNNTSRLRLWFAVMEGDSDLIFLISDAAGREHRVKMETSRYFGSWSHPRSVLETFSCWYQGDSDMLAPTAPLEERVMPEYMDAAKTLVWPRPYALSGILLSPAKKTRNALADEQTIKSGRGRLFLGLWDAISFNGHDAKNNWFLEERGRWGWDTQPLVFPDDLSTTEGEKHYSLELRQGFQGPVIWRKEGVFSINKKDAPGLFRNAIKLPVPARGRYFLEARVWTPDGLLEGTRWMQLYVHHSETEKNDKIPASLEWTSKQDSHVFPSGGTAVLSLKQFSGAGKSLPSGLRCQVTIKDWQEQIVFSESREFTPNFTVTFNKGKPGHCYVIEGLLFDKSRLINQAKLMFGFRNSEKKTDVIIPETVPDRDALMKGRVMAIAEHWGEFFQHYGPTTPPLGYGLPVTPERVSEFDEWLKSLPELGFDTAAFYFNPGMIEPLPGVLFLDELDRRIALAEKSGLKVVLTPTSPNSNPYREPIWSDVMPILDQYGYTLADTQAKLTWPGMWSMLPRYAAFLKSLAAHFADNPTVVAWNLEKLAPRDREAYENKTELRVADYSQEAQEAYARWRMALGLRPEPLARRFSLPGNDTPRTGPDFSEAWKHTMEFRAASGYEWVKQLMEAVRSVDPKRAILIYQMATMANVMPLLDDGGVLLPEGGPNYNELYVSSMLAQRGTPYAHEPSVFVPRMPSHIDSCFFYSSCFSQEAVWKFRWHQQAFNLARFSTLTPTLEFLRNSLPHYREWYAAKIIEPEVLVFGCQVDTLLDAPRRISLVNLAGFKEFVSLYQYHQIPAHFANEYADWVDFSKFKLVIVAGGVLPERTIEKLTALAKTGKKMLIVGNAGRFAPEHPNERDMLSRTLRGMRNVRHIAPPAVPVPKKLWATHGHAKTAFDREKIEAALSWGGVSRNIFTAEPGFDVLLREGDAGHYYAAVLRRLEDGRVPGSVLPEDIQGTLGCTVSLRLPAGRYHIERFHRTSVSLGNSDTDTKGLLNFRINNVEQGELLLFRITPIQ